VSGRGESSFDRVRPRTPTPPAGPAGPVGPAGPRPIATPASRQADQQGRRALFSVDEPAPPAFGAVSIECGTCHQVTVLGLRQALKLAVPSLYLPVIKGRHPVRLHCPACGRWTWTRVRVRL
jgi:hypothetical protein